MGWTAQRKLQGVDLASASASASAIATSSPIKKQPQVVKQPQVQVVKQPQVQVVKQPQVFVKQMFSPPPPVTKVIALKKYG
ncbi:g1298 [Coccomyxa elongata]